MRLLIRNPLLVEILTSDHLPSTNVGARPLLPKVISSTQVLHCMLARSGNCGRLYKEVAMCPGMVCVYVCCVLCLVSLDFLITAATHIVLSSNKATDSSYKSLSHLISWQRRPTP